MTITSAIIGHPISKNRDTFPLKVVIRFFSGVADSHFYRELFNTAELQAVKRLNALTIFTD